MKPQIKNNLKKNKDIKSAKSTSEYTETLHNAVKSIAAFKNIYIHRASTTET